MKNKSNFHHSNTVSAYYLDKCHRDDPDVNNCLRNSANKLARYLQQGVPELGIEEVRVFHSFQFNRSELLNAFHGCAKRQFREVFKNQAIFLFFSFCSKLGRAGFYR